MGGCWREQQQQQWLAQEKELGEVQPSQTGREERPTSPGRAAREQDEPLQ